MSDYESDTFESPEASPAPSPQKPADSRGTSRNGSPVRSSSSSSRAERRDVDEEEADAEELAHASLQPLSTVSKIESNEAPLPPQPQPPGSRTSSEDSRSRSHSRTDSRTSSQTRSRVDSRSMSQSSQGGVEERSDGSARQKSRASSEHSESHDREIGPTNEPLDGDAVNSDTKRSIDTVKRSASSSIRTGSSRSTRSAQSEEKVEDTKGVTKSQSTIGSTRKDTKRGAEGKNVGSKSKVINRAAQPPSVTPSATHSYQRRYRDEQPLTQEEIQQIRDQVELADQSSVRRARAAEQQRVLDLAIQNFYKPSKGPRTLFQVGNLSNRPYLSNSYSNTTERDRTKVKSRSRSPFSSQRMQRKSVDNGRHSELPNAYAPLPYIASAAAIQRQLEVEAQIFAAATIGRGVSPSDGLISRPLSSQSAPISRGRAGRVGSITSTLLAHHIAPHKPLTPSSVRFTSQSTTPSSPSRSPYLSKKVPYTTFDKLYDLQPHPPGSALPPSRLPVPKPGNVVSGKGNWRRDEAQKDRLVVADDDVNRSVEKNGTKAQSGAIYIPKSSTSNPHSPYGRFRPDGSHFSRRGKSKEGGSVSQGASRASSPPRGNWSSDFSTRPTTGQEETKEASDIYSHSMSRTLAADVDIWTLKCSLLTLTYAKVLSKSEDYARRQLKEQQVTKLQQIQAIYTEANEYMKGWAKRLNSVASEEETQRSVLEASELEHWSRLEAAAAANAKNAKSQEEVFPQCVVLSEGQKHIIEQSQHGSFVLDLRWTGAAGDAVIVCVLMYTADNRLCFTASGDEMLRCPKSGLPILRSWGEFKFSGRNNAAGKRITVEFLLHNLAPSVGIRKIFVALLPPAKHGSSLKYLRRAYVTVRSPSDGTPATKLVPESEVEERCAISIAASRTECAGLVVASLIAGPPLAKKDVDPKVIASLQRKLDTYKDGASSSARVDSLSQQKDNASRGSKESSRASTPRSNNSPASSRASSPSHEDESTEEILATTTGNAKTRALAAEVAFADTNTCLPWALVNVLKPLDGIMSQRLLPKRIENLYLLTEPTFTLQYQIDLNRILMQNEEALERFWRDVIADLTQAVEREAIVRAFEKGSEDIKMAVLKRLRDEEGNFGARRASHYPQRSVSLSGATPERDRRVSVQRKL